MATIENLIQNYTPSAEAVTLLEAAHVVLFCGITGAGKDLSLIHISEPTRPY